MKADGCENVCVAACDVSEESQIVAAVELARRTYGGLDILILNAGVFPGGTKISALDDDAWRKVMGINLDANKASVKFFTA